jgi:1,4-dihydroxy-2-naphthoate octaprenyltransferase
MPIAEPTLAVPMNPVAKYLLATRPPFLTVTLVGCLIGLATAWHDHVALDFATAAVTIVFAVVAQAGANVLNDYYDARNGTDAANVDRVYPFTGGSRFIQNGVLTESQMLAFGTALMLATIGAGLWLMAIVGGDLFWFGFVGLLIAWAYSATPLALNSRGLGELCIWIAWMLVAAGADFVQRKGGAALPWVASAGYALLVTNILYINQFPDRKADEAAGKRHWVVRLGPERAARIYPALGIAANVVVVAAVAAGRLPVAALAALLALPLTLKASRDLARYACEPAMLAPAIQATIGAALAHGVLLAAGVAIGR